MTLEALVAGAGAVVASSIVAVAWRAAARCTCCASRGGRETDRVARAGAARIR